MTTNKENAADAVRRIKWAVEELVTEYLPNDPVLGDNGVVELVVRIENAAELIVTRWEKCL